MSWLDNGYELTKKWYKLTKVRADSGTSWPVNIYNQLG